MCELAEQDGACQVGRVWSQQTAAGLAALVQQLGAPQVLVLGDVILDRYTWGDAERVSQEAPVVLLRADRCEERLGGAASVCHMLRGLGARPALAGVVGDDADADCLRDALRRAEVACSTVLTDPSRPTTVKHRFIGRAQQRHPHQMLRVDREARDPISERIQSKLAGLVMEQLSGCDIVLVSDYAKGVCTPELLRRLFQRARAAGKRVLVDPRLSNDYRLYRGASAITPNRLEAGLATGRRIGSQAAALETARQIRRLLELEAALVTLDREGMALAESDGSARIIPTRRRQVYDITGAGDMVLAMLGVSLAAGLSYEQGAWLANVAGGLEVEKIGVALVSRREILADLGSVPRREAAGKILDRESLAAEVQQRRSAGQRVVLTNGCFDLLHVGHVRYLEEAATLGDCLIVAINSDRSLRQLKGPGRPIIGQADRAAMLAALEVVDYVTIFDEQTPHALLRRIRPDVLIKGGTYTTDQVVGKEVVEAYGGQVAVGGAVPGLSTSALIERIVRQNSAAVERAQRGGDRASDGGPPPSAAA